MHVSELSLKNIQAAMCNVRNNVHYTPVFSASLLGNYCGINLFLKCDSFQKSGSFKARGVYHKISQLSTNVLKTGLIAYSSGNHGQALAWAARIFGTECTLVMPQTVPHTKVEAARGYGARCILCGDVTQAYAMAREIERRDGLLFIPAFEDPLIMAGHGTASLEIIEQVPHVDAVVIGIGGGGLIAGMAAAVKQVNPQVSVIGVEPEGAPSMRLSLDEGKAVRLSEVSTLADGLAAPMAGELAYNYVKKYVDEVVTVNDDEIVCAMRLLLSRCKIFSEPSGAAPVAAILNKKFTFKPNANVVAFISGGNIDFERLKSLL
jgi:threonine dehydratase